MKKIGKKVSYLVKILMAMGLLFNNIMPLSVVLAEELGDNDTVIVGDGNENQNDNDDDADDDENLENDETNDDEGEGKGLDDEMPGESTGDGIVGDGVTDEGSETPGEENPTGEPAGEEPVNEEVFTVELNDEYQIIVKYVGEYSEEGVLAVSENMTYIDGSNSGDVNNTIELTDDVKAALEGDGYVLDSQLFSENEYPGEYSVTATLGEKSETFNKSITFSKMDFEFDLLAYEEGSLYADVIMPDENGKYVVGKDYKELIIVAMIGQGNTCPSMSFIYGMTEYNAVDISNGIDLEDISLDGHLYGEFSIPLSGTFTDCYGNVTDLNENRTIVYGTYQDDTDKLNESAKNVELDNKYIFFGDTGSGYVYNLEDIDSSEIESIIKDAFGDDGSVEYTVVTEGNNFTITLTDELGMQVTYTGTTLSTDTKIVARFDSDTDEVSSGDTFTLSYVVTLKDFKINGISGLVTYDKELLKLTDMSASKFTTGNNKDDKFTYVGDAIAGREETDENDKVTIVEEEYILLTLTFEALKAGEATISTDDAKFYDASEYYEADGEITKTIIINEGTDNSLSSLTVAGQSISLEEDKLEYEITVGNDVTSADVEALTANISAKVTSIVAPEELAVGENTITVEVTAENGDVKVYTIKVIREAAEENATSDISVSDYQNEVVNDDSSKNDDPALTSTTGTDSKTVDSTDDEETKGNNVTRIIVIILILLAIAGLIYLIFKDEDDEETKKANRDIDKFKDEDEKPFKKVDNHKNNNNHHNNKNSNKKGR